MWLSRSPQGMISLCVVAALCGVGAKHHKHHEHRNQTVHLTFSNHLDIGFGGIAPYLATDDQVINIYFDVYFPKAIEVGRKLRERGGPERLKWMTQSFLVSLYLDCPPGMGLHCPGSEALSEFEDAVRAGDITWHAFPYNGQVELMDESLLEYAMEMTHALDTRFGLPPKATMSQRDVPGLTRAALPALAKQGVRAVSVGVNGGSSPPAVPHNTPFVWRDLASGAEVLATWHPGGYGGISRDEDCVITHRFDHVLCPYWRSDNAGPPSFDEVLRTFEAVRKEFPGANVIPSTFDEYLQPLLEAAPDLKLPVVTAEIGDTWIWGIQSDPYKVSEFRSLLRLRRAIHWDYPEPWYLNFSRMMLKVPEHTWGVDVKTVLADFEHYSNPGLHSMLALRDLRHKAVQDSWRHQRGWNQWAIEALASDPRGAELLQREASGYGQVGANTNSRGDDGDGGGAPSLEGQGYERLPDLMALEFESASWRIRISNKTGAIIRLQKLSKHGEGGVSWASSSSPLMWLQYDAYTEVDYDVIWKEYAYWPANNLPWWFRKDFGKDGADSHAPTRHEEVSPEVVEAWTKQNDNGGMSIALELKLPSWTVRDYGGCASMRVTLTDPVDPPNLLAEVLCVDKTPTRLPEAMWVRFRPNAGAADVDTWRLTKLGRPIHPHGVVRNGSHAMHAVGDEGIYVTSQSMGQNGHKQRLTIRSLDAATVSPGKPNIFPQVRHNPDLTAGMAFNLWNNVWGTNYVMWIPYNSDEPNLRFRFEMAVDDMTADVMARDKELDREEEVLQQLRGQLLQEEEEPQPQGEEGREEEEVEEAPQEEGGQVADEQQQEGEKQSEQSTVEVAEA